MLASVALAALLSTAQAASLNAWGPATGAGQVAVSPFLGVGAGGAAGSLYGAVGVGDFFDLNLGLTQAVDASGAAGPVELMPRIFLLPSVGVAVHAIATPGEPGLTLSSALHGEWSRGPFTLGANLAWVPGPATGAEPAAPGEVTAILAPELWMSDRVSAYLEVDPTFSLEGQGAALTLVPGLCVNVDRDGAHQVAVGVGLPTAAGGEVTGGLWYATAWAAGSRRARPAAGQLVSRGKVEGDAVALAD